MPQSSYVLPLLMPERQLVRSLPAPYNAQATPYAHVQEFSSSVSKQCASKRKLKLRACKVIFVGDVSVGKTAVVSRFCYDKFQNNYKATIGVDFEIESFNILAQNFCLEIWDTAGQERFKCIAQAYYRNANVIVLVYDMTKPETLQSVTTWLKSALAVNSLQQPLVFLVGTKSDLLSRSAFVRMERAATELAANIGAEYWSVSARTGFNVVRLFQRLAALAFDSACKQAIMERDSRERSISTQMRKKSQLFDFSKNLNFNEKCETGRRGFCLC